jgi:hypothetical protein
MSRSLWRVVGLQSFNSELWESCSVSFLEMGFVGIWRGRYGANGGTHGVRR